MSTKKKPAPPNNQNLTIIAAVIAVAVVAAGAFIFLSTNSGSSSADVDYGSLVQERTADGGFILGDPDAPVTIVEFADFLCPHCQSYKPTMNRVIEELVATGQARFEFRMLPISDSSSFVFQVAECTDDMIDNGFWVGHDEIFKLTSSGTQPDDIGRELADNLGFSYAELLECTSEADQWQTDANLASSAGVSGTPGMRIRFDDGPLQPISGIERGAVDYGVIKATVDAANAAS